MSHCTVIDGYRNAKPTNGDPDCEFRQCNYYFLFSAYKIFFNDVILKNIFKHV